MSKLLFRELGRGRYTYRVGRAWKSFNSEAFISDVAAIDWNVIVRSSDDCEKQWVSFATTLNGLLNVHAPKRRFRVHNPRGPPVSPETLDLMAQRRSARENNDPSYKRLNVVTKRAIRTDCRQNLEQRIRNAGPSNLYKELRPVIAPKKGTDNGTN